MRVRKRGVEEGNPQNPAKEQTNIIVIWVFVLNTHWLWLPKRGYPPKPTGQWTRLALLKPAKLVLIISFLMVKAVKGPWHQ